MDGAASMSASDVAAASSSILWASWEGKGEEIAPMGSEGSTKAELDSERIGMREKTPKVMTSSEPAGSDKEGSAMLGCASACAAVGAAFCTTMLITFWSIRP